MYSFEQFPGWSDDCLKVSHAFELPYFFDSIKFNYKFKPNEENLAVQMKK
jgi:hypothetical protein